MERLKTFILNEHVSYLMKKTFPQMFPEWGMKTRGVVLGRALERTKEIEK
jgi:hypothetical protein